MWWTCWMTLAPAADVTPEQVKAAVARVEAAAPVDAKQLEGTWVAGATYTWFEASDEVLEMPNGFDLELDSLGAFRQGASEGWYTFKPSTRSLTMDGRRDDATFRVSLDGDRLDLVSAQDTVIVWGSFTRSDRPPPAIPAPVAVDADLVQWLLPMEAWPRPREAPLDPATCAVPVFLHPRGLARVDGPITGCTIDYHPHVARVIEGAKALPDPQGRPRTAVVNVAYVIP